MKRMHVIVSGRVQGVCFRLETRQEAQRVGVAGWVRNRRDGTVEAVFEGEAERVARMVAWCRQGPPQAGVTGVAAEEEPAGEGYPGFEIRH